MNSFYINGGNVLAGELNIYPAKNAILPILAGCVITDSNVVIKNCCKFSDVLYMIKILESLGVVAVFDGLDLRLDLSGVHRFEINDEQTKKVRSSIFMLGALLSRFNQAKVAYPGGCNIGTRPIDLHLLGLKKLNVKISEEDGYILCDGSEMKSGIVEFNFPSVGATENIMMASVFLKGTTTIIGAAREPEIVDLQDFLNSMGAKIKGAGTNKIIIKGVDKLTSTVWEPIPDRIVTGTYMIAAAITGGDLKLTNVVPQHNKVLIKMLKRAGCKITKLSFNSLRIIAPKRLKCIPNIETKPYPGFPTDLQSPLLVLQTVSKGISHVTENLYETRFKMTAELIKMGAKINIRNKTAIVEGVERLNSANVTAPDLRSGAGLVIAGLVASGTTIVENAQNVDRGYLNFDQDLQKIGADIVRKIKE